MWITSWKKMSIRGSGTILYQKRSVRENISALKKMEIWVTLLKGADCEEKFSLYGE
jgi:hypothetical protein